MEKIAEWMGSTVFESEGIRLGGGGGELTSPTGAIREISTSRSLADLGEISGARSREISSSASACEASEVAGDRPAV